MLIKSGLRSGEQPLLEGQHRGQIRHEVHQLHGFRKFFDTALINTGLNLTYVDRFQGRSGGIQDHYFRPTDSERLSEYARVIDALTIDPNTRQAARIKELENEKETDIKNLQRRLSNVEEAFLRRTESDFNKLLNSHSYIEPESGKRKIPFEAIIQAEKELLRQAETNPEHFKYSHEDPDFD